VRFNEYRFKDFNGQVDDIIRNGEDVNTIRKFVDPYIIVEPIIRDDAPEVG